jgi:hypothetical protein
VLLPLTLQSNLPHSHAVAGIFFIGIAKGCARWLQGGMRFKTSPPKGQRLPKPTSPGKSIPAKTGNFAAAITTDDVIVKIYQQAKGLPRLINPVGLRPTGSTP